MIKKLEYEEVKFKFSLDNIKLDEINEDNPIEMVNIYRSIKPFISCKNDYNYGIWGKFDEFSIKNFCKYLKEKSYKREAEDIVIYNEEGIRKPYFLPWGDGARLKSAVEELKNAYGISLLTFQNNTESYMEDEDIQRLTRKKDEIIESIRSMAKERGLEIDYKHNTFNFIPIVNGEKITEEGFERLSFNDRYVIMENIKYMKNKAMTSLASISDLNTEYRNMIKNKFIHFLSTEINRTLQDSKQSIGNRTWTFLQYINENIREYIVSEIDENTLVDEEAVIQILNMYCIDVIVDNKDGDTPIVYEDKPSYENLFGYMRPKTSWKENKQEYQYEIQAGSLLKANGGFLIIPITELLKEPTCYNYLKKVLRHRATCFNRDDVLTNIFQMPKPKCEDIAVDVNVILIGEEKYFYMMHKIDEEFGQIFKITLESQQNIEIDGEFRQELVSSIRYIGRSNNCLELKEEGYQELIRMLCRESDNRYKFVFDRGKIKDLLCAANISAKYRKKEAIECEDLHCGLLKKTQVEKEILNSFKENNVLLNVQGSKVGQINGISVIDLGYCSIGRPVRITCTCCKGRGNIIDVQRETSLSGKIHNKSLGILRGFLNALIGNYNGIPVDFNISFEQVYGMVEGDSASVAEALVIVSSFLKVPLKQSIAVTGSINQLGEVQVVGGINEKIEGYYNTSKIKGGEKCGILIPGGNIKNIVLNREVEEAVRKNEFSIYTMEKFQDAVDLMLDKDEINFRSYDFIEEMQKEIKKYDKKEKNKY